MPDSSKRLSVWMLLFLLVPVCAYAMVMILAVFREGNLQFGRLDLGVLLLVLGYAGVAMAAVGWRNGHYSSRFLLVTYSLLFALAISEVALRTMVPTVPPGTPWPPMRRVSVAADTMPGIEGTIEFTVNSLGLRGPEVDLDKVDLRILCVGGSTTESLYVTDKLSWPWLLQDKLSQRLGKSVFVGNAGRSGHFTLNHEYLLKNYALTAKFDWVIVLAGINDWGALINRRSYERRKRVIAEETLTFSSRNRASYRSLVIVQLLEAVSRRGDTMVQDPEGKWYAEAREKRQAALKRKMIREFPADFEQALATYGANLKRIVSLTNARGQQLLLITQPTMYRKGLPEDLERLLWAYSAEGAYSADVLEQMMKAFNQTMLDVCAEEAVACLDLASMLPKDTSTFYDDAHFNISGSQKIAAILADFLVARLTTDGPQTRSRASKRS